MLGPAVGLRADEPRAEGTPVYVIVDRAEDLESLRRRIDRPDFVILRGSSYETLKGQARDPSAPPSPLRGVIESVVVGGELLEDLADLNVEFGIGLSGESPAWVPVRLDGLIPTSAREGDEELPVRSVAGSWQVKIRGEGAHRVRFATTARIATSLAGPQGRRLELTIPEAASTRVNLIVGANASDFATMGQGGFREGLVLESIEGGQRHRLGASLTPRRKLDLSWRRTGDDASLAGPPLLNAQGEIAIDVERGTLRAKSSWDVRSERGTVRELELRIDPSDELIGLESDGRPVLGEGGSGGASGLIRVPLAEPLRPGGVTRLDVTTRRAFAPEMTARMTYRGVPFLNVVAQNGLIAVSQKGGDPWVGGTAGRGLRQIDPKTELSSTLRALPSIVLAYHFVEQPFDLAIQVDPAPPWVQVQSRTTVTLESGRARVDSWLSYDVLRGRIFETKVAIPPELTLELVGPESAIAASERIGRAPDSAGGVLACRLTPRASEDGHFAIHLSGWQALGADGPVKVGLPRPIDAQSRGGTVALLASRGLSVEVARDSGVDGEAFLSASAETPPNWNWPSGRPGLATSPPIWLRSVDSPDALALVTTRRDREVREAATLGATVERDRLEVRQVSDLRVRFGVLESVEIDVPAEVDGAWEVDAEDVSRRDALGVVEPGSIRYRLTLTRPATEGVRLRFRIRQDLAAPLTEAQSSRLAIPRLKVLGAESGPVRATVAEGPDIDLEPQGPGWSSLDREVLTAPPDGTPSPRFRYVGTGPAVVTARSFPKAALPIVVASRLWLRTTREPSGALRTSAWYRVDRHDGLLKIALPEGAEWLRAQVGGQAVALVDRADDAPDSFAIKLPEGSTGPDVVAIDYRQEAAETSQWAAPRLLDGGVVQECFWEARIPWTHALAGVPARWSDANRWAWGTYAFMRSPDLPYDALSSWITGEKKVGAAADPSDREGAHSFLFWKIGDPTPLRPTILSRAGLVASCSGSVLAIGLLLMLARPRGLAVWVAMPSAILAAAVFVPPSILGLVVQSGLVGVLLLAIAFATKRLVDRRGPTLSGFVEASRSGLNFEVGSSRLAQLPDLGSEGSTVIRGRPGTTIDHAPAAAGATGTDHS